MKYTTATRAIIENIENIDLILSEKFAVENCGA